jgi:CubicO group peptidase (beta-lactamase class C family)
MKRRIFLQGIVGSVMTARVFAAVQHSKLDEAAGILERSVASEQVYAAALHVEQGGQVFSRTFGAATSSDDIFLLASISKPMSVAALMTLYDQGKFRLDDPVREHIPEFAGDRRDKVTVRHLLTHTCGLPDQLPENGSLRQQHASLSEFVRHAIATPLLFDPGSRYSYSSMGILLAAEIAQRLSGVGFHEFMDTAVFRPLGMNRSALGLGRFSMQDVIRCQLVKAAPESGGGDAAARQWDWNSDYWRRFGAPWGGVHGSAPDLAKFFAEFLRPSGRMLAQETARLTVQNHNPPNMTPRGLGFAVGSRAGSRGCSERTFGHTGATGTIAWADAETDTICVVLTTLPGNAVNPHPRQLASDLVAEAVR